MWEFVTAKVIKIELLAVSCRKKVANRWQQDEESIVNMYR